MNSQVLHIAPIPSELACSYRSGGTDANGQQPERHRSDGCGVPCRHCLSNVKEGQDYLILSYRPFANLQPYAECGPIFLHAQECVAYQDTAKIPEFYLTGEKRIVRGYSIADRIVYGTGKIVAPTDIATYSGELFDQVDVSYIHVRSSRNNFYGFRIDRGRSVWDDDSSAKK